MCSNAGKKGSATEHTTGREIAAASDIRAPSAWYTRFLKTLKTHEIAASAQSPRLPHYSSTAAVSLFMRHPDKLEEVEQEQLTAFRRAAPSLETTYQLVQDFLVMMREPRRRALGCLALAGS